MAVEMLRFFLIFAAFLHSSSCSSQETILGHMLPLGSHQKPGTVEERFDIPSAKEFFDKYVIPSKPVVFRGILKDSPMLHKWTDEYLVEKYPDLELRLEAKTEKEGYVPIGKVGMGRDTMKNFVETYHHTNKYVVSELPTPAWNEVFVPSFMTCGPIRRNFVEIDLWMSGGNTSSLLHKDAFNALNCLFNGTKEWKLFEYKYEKDLYKAYEPGDPYGGFSRINPEAVDLNKYPKVARVPWSFTTVNKGDCLFLPKSMYHQVKSFGTMNTAVALLFSRFDKIIPKKMKFTDCPSEFLPLSEIDVDWQYPGKGVMFMGYSELDEVKQGLLGLFEGKSANLFQNILKAVTLKDFHPMNATERAEKLLKILKNGDENKKITRKSVLQLPRSALREAGFLIEPLIPSNTYDYEYFQISPSEIAELLSILVKQGKGIVKRNDFVVQYQERLWGSEKFGNSLFNDLAGENIEEVTKEDIVKNFHIAAKKFDKKDGTVSEGDDDDEEKQGLEDDAYVGRTIDLTAKKDMETLKDLGKQILDGDFSDKSRSYGARTGANDDDDDDDSNSDDDDDEVGKEDVTEGEDSEREAPSNNDGVRRDEL